MIGLTIFLIPHTWRYELTPLLLADSHSKSAILLCQEPPSRDTPSTTWIATQLRQVWVANWKPQYLVHFGRLLDPRARFETRDECGYPTNAVRLNFVLPNQSCSYLPRIDDNFNFRWFEVLYTFHAPPEVSFLSFSMYSIFLDISSWNLVS